MKKESTDDQTVTETNEHVEEECLTKKFDESHRNYLLQLMQEKVRMGKVPPFLKAEVLDILERLNKTDEKIKKIGLGVGFITICLSCALIGTVLCWSVKPSVGIGPLILMLVPMLIIFFYSLFACNQKRIERRGYIDRLEHIGRYETMDDAQAITQRLGRHAVRKGWIFADTFAFVANIPLWKLKLWAKEDLLELAYNYLEYKREKNVQIDELDGEALRMRVEYGEWHARYFNANLYENAKWDMIFASAKERPEREKAKEIK